MTKVIFTNPLICASNNGYWSDFFIPTWGCWQGCCFSPSGFALVAEALSSALRQNPNIKGIKIGKVEVLLGQLQMTYGLHYSPLKITLTLSYYNLILFYILHSIQSGLVILVTPIRASPHKNLLKHPIFLHHLPANRFSGVCLLPPITASA